MRKAWLVSVMRFLSWLATGCVRVDTSEPAVDAAAPQAEPSAGPGAWLRGDPDQRFALVAKHLRGFDMAMVEVGYRYSELVWAARDRNWGYAAYQLDKIETAVANGVERRPARAASARMLAGAVTAVREAIADRDASAMEAAMQGLTNTCNACHEAERVPFVAVAAPSVRLSPVVYPLPEPDPGTAP